MVENCINPSDISIIFQGPIALGRDGTPKDGHTDISLKSARKHFPGATLILSTWEGSDTRHLDYDVLVENKDPGKNQMGSLETNCFRQIVSSLGGLRVVKTKYAMKTRTELSFTHADVLRYFVRYNEANFDPAYKLIQERVVTLMPSNPRRRTKWPFAVADWFFLGLTEDVLNIFDIPLEDTEYTYKNRHGEIVTEINPISAEQYIWTRFLRKYRPVPLAHMTDASEENIRLSEAYFANNCIFLTARKAGLVWLKPPGGAYAHTPALSDNGLYTANEYRHMLNTYAKNNIVIIPNVPEMIVYALVYYGFYPLRWALRKIHSIIAAMCARIPSGQNS